MNININKNSKLSDDNIKNNFLKKLESKVVDKEASQKHYNEIVNKNNK